MWNKIITTAVCYEGGNKPKKKCISSMPLRRNYKIKSFENNLTDDFIPIWQFFKKYQGMILWVQKYNYILVKKSWFFHSLIQQIFIENLLWATHGVQH